MALAKKSEDEDVSDEDDEQGEYSSSWAVIMKKGY